MLQAYFGGGFHHPHLRGTTVHDWTLNVFSEEDAAAQLSILRVEAMRGAALKDGKYVEDLQSGPFP